MAEDRLYDWMQRLDNRVTNLEHGQWEIQTLRERVEKSEKETATLRQTLVTSALSVTGSSFLFALTLFVIFK